MVAKLQYGNLSSPSEEANTISIRIIDEINFPAYLVAKFINKDGALDTRYNTSDEIMVREFSITDNPVIFRGKIENVLKSVENGLEILTITARDNLAELNMPFNRSVTYSQNGADATINAIIRGHVKNVSDNFALPAVDSNNAAYETSLFTDSISVIGKNNGRSVLKTIQDVAREDPNASAYSSVTNTGWHFYLDGGADMHYHSSPYPSGAVSNSLVLKFGLATGSVSDFYKQILPTPSYSTFDADIVSEVHAHYQHGGDAKVVRLKLITITGVNTDAGPFAAGNNISGNAETGGGTATAQIRIVLSGALLISHATDYAAEAPNFAAGATITQASVGAYATYTTTSGQETDKAIPVHLRRATLVFASTTDIASVLGYVSQTAYPVVRAGFIDISSKEHQKATIRIFDFPIMRRSSVTTVIRPGNTIFVQDDIAADDLEQDFNISKIEYVQEGGKSISSLSLTTLEGSPFLLSGVEKVATIAKDSGIEAQVQIGEGITTEKLIAADGAAATPSITFDGSAGADTGLYEYESGGFEYLGLTANGTVAAYFGEDTKGIFFYEHLNGNGLYPLADETYDIGYTAPYGYRNLYINPTSSSSGTALHWTSSGLIVKDSSSIRYKDNVETLEIDSSKIDKLRPVKFNYKDDIKRGDMNPNIGLIAEEVNEIYPELITYDEKGNPEAVNYGGLSAMLVHEVKKLRQGIRELKEKI